MLAYSPRRLPGRRGLGDPSRTRVSALPQRGPVDAVLALLLDLAPPHPPPSFPSCLPFGAAHSVCRQRRTAPLVPSGPDGSLATSSRGPRCPSCWRRSPPALQTARRPRHPRPSASRDPNGTRCSAGGAEEGRVRGGRFQAERRRRGHGRRRGGTVPTSCPSSRPPARGSTPRGP